MKIAVQIFILYVESIVMILFCNNMLINAMLVKIKELPPMYMESVDGTEGFKIILIKLNQK